MIMLNTLLICSFDHLSTYFITLVMLYSDSTVNDKVSYFTYQKCEQLRRTFPKPCY